MSVSELCFRSDMYEQERAEQVKIQMVAASFTAWQTIAAQGIKVAPWGDYLRKLGLAEKKAPISLEAKKAMAKKGYNIANLIRGSRK